jgi:cellulose biosynthesis protein BcsQ
MPEPAGRIVTFYSYKGGTGRSMLLANVAWILAGSGRRVLVVDWDLEAPGLHRYFHPFLLDKSLEDTDGVIDFVVDFCVAATTPVDGEASDPDWFHPYADITRYAVPVQWERFTPPGRIDFVGAGRQGPTYATRVNGLSWQQFYERFGGGAFIDRAREVMRSRYDFVLIDSRTGVTDTSGICTVQLPDTLVVCFTLNNQSIEGASGIARSVRAQRGDDMPILPVPTRIENAEKEKLDRRRERAMRVFGGLLVGAGQAEREEYWADVELPYVPFYAYEEVLATFKDKPGAGSSVLATAEHLATRIAGEPMRAPRLSRTVTEGVLALYEGVATSRPAAAPAPDSRGVFISYRRSERGHAARIYDHLVRTLGEDRVFMDVGVLPGDDWVKASSEAVLAAAVVVAVIGVGWAQRDAGDFVNRELETALTAGKRVIPVLVDGATMPLASALPAGVEGLVRLNAAVLSDERWTFDVDRVLAAVELASAPRAPAPSAAPASSSITAGSDTVIETVLRTRRAATVNWISIAAAIVSLAGLILVLATQVV